MGSVALNRTLKRWPGWLVVLFAGVALLIVGAARDDGPSTPEERAAALQRQVACPVCDGESVFESANRASINLRNEIRRLVDDGELSDAEILAYVEELPGDVQLLVPQSSGIDTIVWALPAAALVCGAAGLIVAFRRWRLATAADQQPTDDDRDLVAAALDVDGD